MKYIFIFRIFNFWKFSKKPLKSRRTIRDSPPHFSLTSSIISNALFALCFQTSICILYLSIEPSSRNRYYCLIEGTAKQQWKGNRKNIPSKLLATKKRRSSDDKIIKSSTHTQNWHSNNFLYHLGIWNIARANKIKMLLYWVQFAEGSPSCEWHKLRDYKPAINYPKLLWIWEV